MILAGNLIFANSQSKYFTILEKKLITIGISMDYPPLHMYDKKTKRHTGIEIDMAEELAKFLDVKIKFVRLAVSDYTKAIVEKKVDIVISGMSRNLNRSKTIWFSDPYYSISPSVIIETAKLPQTEFGEYFEEDAFSTIWDLKRLSKVNLSAKRGSTHYSLFKSNFSNVTLTEVNTNKAGLATLFTGKVSGFAHDSLYLEYLVKENPSWKSRYTLLTGGTREEYLCIGVPFGDIILLRQLNTWISEIKRTGKLKEIVKKHLGAVK